MYLLLASVATAQRMEQRKITYVPGLYKIFDEILVNAADNLVLGAKFYTPDITNMTIHWNMPLIHWTIPVKIHWTSDNPLENTTEK